MSLMLRGLDRLRPPRPDGMWDESIKPDPVITRSKVKLLSHDSLHLCIFDFF